MRPPRTVFLRWPFGHPLGEPDNREQQRVVILEAFRQLYAIAEPGSIVDLPFRWRRQDHRDWQPPAPAELAPAAPPAEPAS